MIYRLWFRFLGIVLLLLILWGSLWAGFQNFNLVLAFGSADWPSRAAPVLVNYGLVALAVWMLRGGPELIRNLK
jgi:hypothetical protein